MQQPDDADLMRRYPEKRKPIGVPGNVSIALEVGFLFLMALFVLGACIRAAQNGRSRDMSPIPQGKAISGAAVQVVNQGDTLSADDHERRRRRLFGGRPAAGQLPDRGAGRWVQYLHQRSVIPRRGPGAQFNAQVASSRQQQPTVVVEGGGAKSGRVGHGHDLRHHLEPRRSPAWA